MLECEEVLQVEQETLKLNLDLLLHLQDGDDRSPAGGLLLRLLGPRLLCPRDHDGHNWHGGRHGLVDGTPIHAVTAKVRKGAWMDVEDPVAIAPQGDGPQLAQIAREDDPFHAGGLKGLTELSVGPLGIGLGGDAQGRDLMSLGKVQETITVDGGKPTGDAPAATPAGPPSRIRVSGNVQSAKLVKKVNPLYPPEAKQARVQGTVRMRAIIGKEGDVLGLTLLMSPAPELARSAMEILPSFHFQTIPQAGHRLLSESPHAIQSCLKELAG